MLISMVKGESKHRAGVPIPDYGTLFPERLRGQMILGTHFGKYCSRF